MRDYNFFEHFFQKKKKANTRKAYIGILTFIIIGGMGAVFLINILRIKNLENQIYDSKKILSSEEISIVYEKKSKGEQKLEILNTYYAYIDSLNKAILRTDYIKSDLIKTISKVVPGSVSFKSINISDRLIAMEGTSSTRVNIAEVQHNLNKLEIFDDVHVSSIILDKDDTANLSFNFSIRFKLKEDKKNEN